MQLQVVPRLCTNDRSLSSKNQFSSNEQDVMSVGRHPSVSEELDLSLLCGLPGVLPSFFT